MNTASLKFVRFENSDVIATSGTPDVTPLIYVDVDSIVNYNDIAEQKGEYKLLNLAHKGNTYIGYNGTFLPVPGYEGYMDFVGTDSSDGINIYRVAKGDTKQYGAIHDWLIAAQQ